MRYLLFTLICCLSLTSCEKEIPFEIEDDGNKLVLNCFIGPNMESVVAYLSQSQSVLSTTPIFNVPTATVTLFKDGVSLGNFTPEGDGKFTLTHTPEIGANYRIEASVDGLDPIQAETVIPAEPTIDAAVMNPDITEQVEFNITLDDNGNQDNFYQLLLISSDGFGTNPSIVGFTTNSPLLAGNSTPFGGDDEEYFFDNAFFKDDVFSGESISLNLNTFSFSSNLAVQYLNCSEAYYLYRVTLLNYYENDGNPFAQPVQIYSNIEGGLGIFAGYSFDQMDI